MASGSLALVVLAGGEGRRFGIPKAFARINGYTMLERALDAFSSAGDVYVSASPRLVAAIARNVVAPSRVLLDIESLPCRGPLSGIVSASSYLRSYDTLVFIPVDAVWADTRVVEPLIERAEDGCISSYYSGDGRVHPLFAAGSPRSFIEASLGPCLLAEPKRASSVLRSADCAALAGSESAGSPLALTTVNTAEDLARPKPLKPASGDILLEGHSTIYRQALSLNGGFDSCNMFRSEAKLYRALGLSSLERHALSDAARSCRYVTIPELQSLA